MFRNSFCQQWRNSIAYLAILLDSGAGKAEPIREGLDTGSFTHADNAILLIVEKAAPVRVAFGEDGTGNAVSLKASITLCMIAAPRPLHTLRQYLMGNITP